MGVKQKKNNLKKQSKADIVKPIFYWDNAKVYIFLLALITALVFSNALQNNFTNWDDNYYVTENPHIRDLSISGVKNIFSVYVSSHYHPLTLLSLAVDYHFWALNPTAYIAHNIGLHILNVILIFVFFVLFTKNKLMAFVIALICAVHPMRVESVVWIAERKDVLYVFYYLLALVFYLKYLLSRQKKIFYLMAVLSALLALLSKATAASLPFVLLLFDYYYNRKDYKRFVLEKLPFFLLAFVFGLVAIMAQSSSEPNSPPIFDRIFMFSYALTFYIVKFFAPLNLSPLLPFPDKIGAYLPIKYYLSFLIVPLIVFVFFKLRSFKNELVWAFLFFFFTLWMLLIKFPIGPAFLAERYTYLPYIGLTYGLVYLLFFYGGYYKKITGVLLGLYIVFLSVSTIAQNRVWNNSLSLWTKVIEVNPNIEIAYYNRGVAYSKLGASSEAIADFDKVLLLNSEYKDAYNNRGYEKNKLGSYQESIPDFYKAIELNPQYDRAYNNLGAAYFGLGKNEEAIKAYSKAIELNNELAEAYYNRGISNVIMENYVEAVKDYDRAINIEPSPEAFNNRAQAKYLLNSLENALTDYNEAIRLFPNYVDTYINRGGLKYQLGDLEGAFNDCNMAIDIAPNNPKAYFNRGGLNKEIGNHAEACIDWQKAASLGMNEAQHLVATLCN